MVHLGVIVKDNHQKTVEMIADFWGQTDSVKGIHLHIIDNGSKYPYRSYFFENLAWAGITVHRPELPLDFGGAVQLLRSLSDEGDLVTVTDDFILFAESE